MFLFFMFISSLACTFRFNCVSSFKLLGGRYYYGIGRIEKWHSIVYIVEKVIGHSRKVPVSMAFA